MSIVLFFFLTFFNFPTTLANDLMYLKHTCSNQKTFTPNSTYQTNLHTLLTSLSSHAAATDFYNTTAGGSEDIYGLFMCRGDVTNQTCQKCMAKATIEISSKCPYSKEAIIWYHQCMVRYSNRCFFSTVDEWPRHKFMNYSVTTNSTKEGSYGWLLANTLSEAVAEAANFGPQGTKKFATKNATLPGSKKQKVYTLVQCTHDLSTQDCNRCLSDIMSDIPLCCLGKDCGMVLYPSCSLMFGIDQFYRDVALARMHPAPSSRVPRQSSHSGKATLGLINIAMVPVVFLLMLFFANRIRRLNELRRYKAILRENFGNESTTLESLQFNFAAIEAATNKFSDENLIGQGGFGEVYKGTLHDGREVAVKRLSKSSGQDFGMARMVAIDQEQGRTNRIVGTYGYMSPEYAMLGKFSEKSDIFSFGVLVLEIISGRKHSTSYQPYYVDGLLSYAWKQWRDGAPFEILHPSLRVSCSEIEVMKCIQIGLLCVQENPADRPLMAGVVSYLSNPSIELPSPQEPAFFRHGGKEINMSAKELKLGHVAKSNTPYSINEMSITESFPR
ncbi:hypothetical protein TanjilG_30385 [Lupinus angustifolius]|nr:hypothetical protein TanjilG_30385 [Lupinus angustifolius]